MKKFVFSVLVALPLMLFISCSSIGNNEESEDFCITIIDVGVENITFVPSVDGKCKVVCYAENKLEHLVKVYDGKLKIESDDRRNWVEKFFAFCTEENSITVYLPTDIETSLLVTGDTGDIIIPAGFTFDHINISLDTGNVVCNASAKHQIVIKSDTGATGWGKSFCVKSMIAQQKMLSLKRPLEILRYTIVNAKRSLQ